MMRTWDAKMKIFIHHSCSVAWLQPVEFCAVCELDCQICQKMKVSFVSVWVVECSSNMQSVLQGWICWYHLIGLVVKALPREREIRSSVPACAVGIFSGLRHTSYLKIGIPVATLQGTWRFTFRVSAGTGWFGVSNEYTVTGSGRKFNLQFLSQCGSTYCRLSRSIWEIHLPVAGMLSNQQNKTKLLSQLSMLPLEGQTCCVTQP